MWGGEGRGGGMERERVKGGEGQREGKDDEKDSER